MDNVPYTEQILGILNKYKFDTQAISADSGYDTSEIYSEMYKRGIKCFIIPQKRSGKGFAHYGDFKYDEFSDCYFCPENKKISYKSFSVGTGYKNYSISKKECDKCPRRANCELSTKRTITRGLQEKEHQAQQALVGSEEWCEALRLRQIWFEGNLSRQKASHNLNRTRKRGIANVQEQCLLSACALNLKQMVMCME